jgi:uncharacterized membrane protein
MKHTTLFLLAVLTLAACVDSAAPPGLAGTDDPPFAAARSLSSGSTTLPTFGGTSSQAEAINDAGTIVGYANEASPSRYVFGVSYAAKWVRNTEGRWEVTRLGAVQTTNPAPGGRALALNELGDAVGTRDGTALVWPEAGGEVTLPNGAVAEGINTARIIVGGTAWNNSSAALVWTPDAGSTSGWTSRPLLPLEGGTLSHAFAINEGGDIAGTAASASGRWQAVVWLRAVDGGWSAPVPLSGTEASGGNSGGFGINAGGDVVGYYSSCNGCSIHAYFWPTGGGSPRDLAMLNSSTSSGHARGIEDERRVVGFINVPRGNGFGPFLWAFGSATLSDLGTGEANDINNGTGLYGREAVGFSQGSKGSQATVWRIP